MSSYWSAEVEEAGFVIVERARFERLRGFVAAAIVGQTDDGEEDAQWQACFDAIQPGDTDPLPATGGA